MHSPSSPFPDKNVLSKNMFSLLQALRLSQGYQKCIKPPSHCSQEGIRREKGGYESLTEMVGCKSSSSSYYYSGFSTLLQYHILLTHPLSTVMSVLDKRARSHSISIQSGLPLARFVIIYMHFYMHYIYMHM